MPLKPTRRSCSKPKYSDRKSTRLNSSHSQISYAVFCLKKKTEDGGAFPSGTFHDLRPYFVVVRTQWVVLGVSLPTQSRAALACRAYLLATCAAAAGRGT